MPVRIPAEAGHAIAGRDAQAREGMGESGGAPAELGVGFTDAAVAVARDDFAPRMIADRVFEDSANR